MAEECSANRRALQIVSHLQRYQSPSSPSMSTAAGMEKQASLSTHVLDTSRGHPAHGMPLTLYKESAVGSDSWDPLLSATTNEDGRVTLPKVSAPATYKVRFDTAEYFKKTEVKEFFNPYVDIVFRVVDVSHYHIPLLISPFGYTTYRGS